MELAAELKHEQKLLGYPPPFFPLDPAAVDCTPNVLSFNKGFVPPDNYSELYIVPTLKYNIHST